MSKMVKKIKNNHKWSKIDKMMKNAENRQKSGK